MNKNRHSQLHAWGKVSLYLSQTWLALVVFRPILLFLARGLELSAVEKLLTSIPSISPKPPLYKTTAFTLWPLIVGALGVLCGLVLLYISAAKYDPTDGQNK